MSHRFNRLAASLVLAACANLAHAAGFALVEQNVSGLGNAYAGQAAAATDASTIFFNPAGMTYLPDRQVVVAGHLIRPQAEFSGTVNPDIGGGNGGDAGDLALVPNAYLVYRLTPDIYLGVGLNAPFGLKTEYDSDWKGRTQAIKSEVKMVNLNPSIAWKAGDVGFSAAAMLNSPVNAYITLPDSASLSLFHKLDSRWDLLADITWTGWSDFRELRIVRTNGDVLGTPTEENWSDSYRYSLGANYHLNDKLTLRGGLAFDETPVSDAFRTARIPDEDRTWIAFGAQYRLSRKSAIDVGYAHLFIRDAAIDKAENGVTLAGNYEASVDILSAQLTLGF